MKQVSDSINIRVNHIAPSLNAIYAGLHWRKRKEHADIAHLIVKKAVKGMKPIATPVKLTFQPHIKGRRYDVSNYAFTAKLHEDGLVKAGLLPDDTNKWVKSITLLEPIKSDESYMMITIACINVVKEYN